MILSVRPRFPFGFGLLGLLLAFSVDEFGFGAFFFDFLGFLDNLDARRDDMNDCGVRVRQDGYLFRHHELRKRQGIADVKLAHINFYIVGNIEREAFDFDAPVDVFENPALLLDARRFTDEQDIGKNLAQSQMENIMKEDYALSYSAAPIPDVYQYYSAVIDTDSFRDSNIQKITVTIKHQDKDVLELEGYKVNR